MKHDHKAILRYTLSVAALSLLCMTSIVNAQQNTRPFDAAGLNSNPSSSPYQQRLSPYLDLLRSDNSVLGPYHSFVRPRQQFRQNIGVQGAQIEQLQRERRRPLTTVPPSARLQTGRGGTFNNHLHYYQFDQNR